MTITLTDAGTTVSNSETIAGAPAVRIAADGIRFVNTERGRITASTEREAAIVVDAAGAVIVNELGGIIRGFDSTTFARDLAIRGSENSDAVFNSGLLAGPVALRGGDDLFVHTTSGPTALSVAVDLGDGADRFILNSGSSDQYHGHTISGGAGMDTLELNGPISVVDGFRVTGIERLVIGEKVTNLTNFANFSEIVLTAGGFNNFNQSSNPLVDLQLNANFVTIGSGSAFRNVTGGTASDTLELSGNSLGVGTLSGSADLGAGDDSFWLTTFGSSTGIPIIGGTVNGGDGIDTVNLSSGAGLTIDLAKLVGFERINTGTFSSATSTTRLTSLDNYLQVTGDGEGGILTLALSNSPNAAVHVSSKGILQLEATATIGRYGFPTGSFWETVFDQQEQGNDQFNVTVLNGGTILGSVQLYYGDDLYDGRLGHAGGTVFGYAGNDTIYGGVAGDRIEGGFGADRIDGGGGDDVLLGGAGGDIFIDIAGQGNDQFYGGSGNDLYNVDDQSALIFEGADEGDDQVVASIGYYLYANIERLKLAAGAGDVFGVGNDLANVIVGNDGSNLLIAGSGDDIVQGGDGVDALFGQDGADQLSGDAGVDYLVGGAGGDRLDGGGDADSLYGEDGNDTLIGGSSFSTDILVGGAGDDILRGDSGLGDYDLMDGGSGNDSYYVDTPADLTFEAAGGGIDTVYASIAGAGYYLYAGTENLVLLGNTPFGVGNELDNVLTGNAIGNYLLGGAGNDTLNGKGGNDVLFGEGGSDIFVFERGGGGDVIGDFAPGSDQIQLSGLGFSSFVQLQGAFVENGGATAINLGQGDFIVLNGVTNAQLTAADFLFG